MKNSQMTNPCEPVRPINGLALVAPSALATFFDIAEGWGLNDSGQRQVLGKISDAQLISWKADGCENFTLATFERIAEVIQTHSALCSLFADFGQANRWMTAPNDAPFLSGQSAIEFISDGDFQKLRTLRSYVQSQLY